MSQVTDIATKRVCSSVYHRLASGMDHPMPKVPDRNALTKNLASKSGKRPPDVVGGFLRQLEEELPLFALCPVDHVVQRGRLDSAEERSKCTIRVSVGHNRGPAKTRPRSSSRRRLVDNDCKATITEEAIDNHVVHFLLSFTPDVGCRADLNSACNSKLAGVRLRPATCALQAIQPSMAPHTNNVCSGYLVAKPRNRANCVRGQPWQQIPCGRTSGDVVDPRDIDPSIQARLRNSLCHQLHSPIQMS
mmetsp:Transcript_22715/g.49764  ORF Transcript_22715/g.49764 Transcript_22715/m.49764 type:complete len:247 (+) Transcript_22715:633-1373(+)